MVYLRFHMTDFAPFTFFFAVKKLGDCFHTLCGVLYLLALSYENAFPIS